MKITKIQELDKLPLAFDGRCMYSGEKAEIIHITLQPGEKIPLHSNPDTILFFIIEGSGLLETELNTILVKKGSCVFLEPGELRGWKNTGTENLLLLVIKIRSKLDH